MLASVIAAHAQSADEVNAAACHAIESGRLTAAVSQLQTALRRFPDNHQLQLNLGLALVRLGCLAPAIEPLQKCAADPALAGQAQFLLGVDYFANKQYPSAIAELSAPSSTGRASASSICSRKAIGASGASPKPTPPSTTSSVTS